MLHSVINGDWPFLVSFVILCDMKYQNTIQSAVTLTGVGLHSGVDITLSLKPASAGTGIVFVRTDITDGDNTIPAIWNTVVDTQLCTVIANKNGARVGTIEHVMAALRACNIDNCIVEVSGAEVPVMDGSSKAFVDVINSVGIAEQANAPRVYVRVLNTVSVEKDGKTVTLSPSQDSCYTGRIAFDHDAIGDQTYSCLVTSDIFTTEIADARTFGFLRDVEMLRAHGLAKGGSLDNAIVLDDDGVMNENGLRFSNEFARHKVLDAIGDTYLAGAPILGHYEGYKAGHELNNMILHELFSCDENWEYTTQPPMHVVTYKRGAERSL